MNGLKLALAAFAFVVVGQRAKAVDLIPLKVVITCAGYPSDFGERPVVFSADYTAPSIFYGPLRVTNHLAPAPSGLIRTSLPADTIGPGGPWNFADLYFFYLASDRMQSHVTFNPKVTSGFISNLQARISFVQTTQLVSNSSNDALVDSSTTLCGVPVAEPTIVGWGVTLDSVIDLAAGTYMLEVRGYVKPRSKLVWLGSGSGTYLGYLGLALPPIN